MRRLLSELLCILLVGAPLARAADTSQFVEVRGAKLYVETFGGGVPILFLHGGAVFFDNNFAAQRDYFASFRKVIGFDRRGHGHSPDDGRPFSYKEMAEDTAALIEKLGIAPVDVVGHSDGGDIGLILAHDHPSLVRRLVISGAGLGSGIAPDEVKRRSESPEREAEAVARLGKLIPPSFRPDYEKVSPDGPRQWNAFLAKSWRLWMTPVVIERADLAAIPMPVLVMAGDRDLSSLEETIAIYRALPKGQLAILPGTGHGTFTQRPDLSNLLVREFLEADSR
ncbi:MAG TPA: alpha/beta hydrolase [Usitatibacter sp.]|nr:alpha/beta hydrolase [Usitatibacter sp.]